MERSNLFDNDIRSRFEGFMPEPPADAWLSVRDAIVVTPPGSMLPLYFRVAAAVAFLAISGLSIMYLTTDHHTATPLADAEALTSTPLSPSAVDVPGETTFSAPATVSSIQSAPAVSSLARVTVPATLPGTAAAEELLHQGSSTVFTAPYNRQMIAMTTGISISAPLVHTTPSLADRDLNSQFSTVPGHFSRGLNDVKFAEAPARPGGNTGITLGMHVSPRYNDRHIADQGSLMTSIPFNMYEKSMAGYSYGASVSFRILPRLELQTGIGFSGMAQMINDINVWGHFDSRPFYETRDDKMHPQNIMTSMGVIALNTPNLYFSDGMSERVVLNNETKNVLDVPADPKLLDPLGEQLTQSFSFVEIPLIARYRLLGSRYIDIYMKAGVAGNVLTRNEVMHQSNVIGETSGVRSFSYSGIGGLAFAVPLTNRLKLFVEPTAQMFLQPILTDNMLSTAGKTYPYSFTVASGLSFRF